jgi:diguanylate cyclase (GGDEF)-like protein/PAS domain S-box-containing protein
MEGVEEGSRVPETHMFTPPMRSLAWLKERASRHRAAATAGDGGVTMPVDTQELGLFGALLRGSVDAIIVGDLASEWILEVSDSFEALTGYSRNELIGRTSLELGLVEDHAVHARATAHAHAGVGGTYEIQLLRKDGTRAWVEFTQQIIDGQYVLTILRDVTGRKHLEHDLRMLAQVDELTGISNRRHFQQEVEKHLRASRRFGDPLTLMLLDVDGLKQINDTYGHQIGDKALQVVARALHSAVRETDLVGRLGGDEFVALLARADDRGINRVIGAFSSALHVEDAASGVSFPIEASIGVARSDGSDDTCESLLRRADRAMYEEKAKKKKRERKRKNA